MTEVAANLGANPRADRRVLILLGIVGAMVLLFLIHLGLGSTSFVTPVEVLRELMRGRLDDIGQLTGKDPSQMSPEALRPYETLFSQNGTVWALRLPKALYCVLAGGILGVVGSTFQALFRNPLAEPFTIGVSSGAAIGGVVAQIIGLDAGLAFLGTPLLGFVGGMASLLLVFGLARRRHGSDGTTLLLAGVVVSSLLSALLSVTVLLSGADTNALMQWLLGSTSPTFWERVALLAVVLGLGSIILFAQTRKLNAFAIGEVTAQRLGVDPSRLRWSLLIVGTAMTATAVGTVGIVAFLGLVAPHISRRLIGVDWRWSLPGSLFAGATLMLAADTISQRFLPWLGHALTGQELLATGLPIGVGTALLGAPSLLILLRKAE